MYQAAQTHSDHVHTFTSAAEGMWQYGCPLPDIYGAPEHTHMHKWN